MTDDNPHVDPASTVLRLRRHWDAALERTEHLHPAASHAALLDWQPAIWPDDGGMPVEIGRPLSRAFARIGTACACADPALAAALRRMAPPRRLDRLWRGRRDPIVATGDAAAIARLLDTGWATQMQLVLLLDPAGDPAQAVAALDRRADWRSFVMAPPVRLLVAPANDGDGVLLAAATAQALNDALEQVRSELCSAGFDLSSGRWVD